MGAVLVIFSFSWMNNDLVCVPPPLSHIVPIIIVVFLHHNYAHILVHISKTTLMIFLKFWEVPNNIRVTNLQLTKKLDFLLFAGGRTSFIILKSD